MNLRIIALSISILSFSAILVSCEDLLPNVGLSEQEVVQGLKEALSVGTDTSVSQANKTDGYYQNQAIKIFFPEEAAVVQSVVSAVPGGNLLIDELILKLNRAAETAASEAGPIFKDAILGITIGDAFAILDGQDDAATQFLQTNTETELYTAFKPDIESALSSVGAQQAWNEVITVYNSIPFVTPVNTDLADYTTNEALDGLFFLVAEEEAKIRKDPLHRVSEILEKVFGS
ncbi:MAG: DUF4197 domain-containing protein [Chitinophagales bacterium]|nr:DUF4197 domain-containing protein [Chitinophagales bacterium]